MAYGSRCGHHHNIVIQHERPIRLARGCAIYQALSIDVASLFLFAGFIPTGAKDVIVTLGSRGCMWVSAAKAPLASDGFRFRRFLADEVVATDTVGAGDAFVGALAAYLSQGLDLESSIGKAVG